MFSRQLFLFPVLHCTTFTSQLFFLIICIYFEHLQILPPVSINKNKNKKIMMKIFFVFSEKNEDYKWF